jgi:hypothetical protein
MDRGKGNDDLALMVQFRHRALGSRKNSVTDSDSRSDADALMGPQEQSTSQAVTNLVKYFATDHVSSFIAQQAKHTGSGDNRDPALG